MDFHFYWKLFKPDFIGFAALMMLFLSACQPITPPVTTAKEASPQPEQAIQTTVKLSPAPKIADNQTATQTNAPAPVTQAVLVPDNSLPATPSQPVVSDIDPRSFIGQPLDHILNALGEADFRRVEGRIGVWQYRQPNCVVDFFFPATQETLNLATTAPTALDIRNRILGQPLNEKKCRAQLFERRL